MAEITAYKVSASPHKTGNDTTRRMMLDVLIALLPCLVAGVVFYGLWSLLLVAVCMVTCFASEQLFNLVRKKPFTFDLSALVTGLILGLNLPPRAPWYIPIIGGVFAIVLVKMLFGGLGKNFANPAATARVFLLLAYSGVMTSWIGADVSGNILAGDVATSATYLGGGTAALADSFLGVRGYWAWVLQLFLGYTGGSIGETCSLAILLGFIYLTVRRVIDWRIPLSYLLTAAVMTLICYGDAYEILLQLLSGGMLFGAVFMATDYATSPKWRYNRILYGVGLGIITMLIRAFGTYPEGTSLAILIMNLLVPLMDKYILPVRFGQRTKHGKPKPQAMKWTMRALCLAMAASVVIAAPVLAAQNPYRYEYTPEYVQGFSLTEEGYVFDVAGVADIGGYKQPVAYTVTIDEKKERVTDIDVVVQSTMGYEAELSFFIGKTEREIRRIGDLSTDADTSATITNTALRNMILECFEILAMGEDPYEYSPAYVKSQEKEGTVYTFSVEGAAYLPDYDYTQPLAYTVRIDMADGRVSEIVPVTQSTMGFEAELAFFVGKTHAQVLGLTDLSTDADTSATYTNTQLRAMVLECFYVAERAEAANG